MASLKYKLFSPVFSALPDRVVINLMYFVRNGRIPYVDQPRLFSEFLQWRKLHSDARALSVYASKLRSKELVGRLSLRVKVPHVFWSGTRFHDRVLHDLPDRFILKANHGSGMNHIVYDSSKANIRELARMCRSWLRRDMSAVYKEWPYRYVERKVFAEELLTFAEGIPNDYKFFVFHGEVVFVQVDINRFGGHKQLFLDHAGKRLDIRMSYPEFSGVHRLPENFSSMIEAAREIGSDIDFVRVDLYSDDHSIYFGETTLFPGGGFAPVRPREFDEFLGKVWRQGLDSDVF